METNLPGVALAVEVTRSDCATAWESYVATHPDATIYHDYRWRDVVVRAFGRECHYLAAREARDGRVVGVLPLIRQRSLVFGDYLVSLPYFNYGGVVADCPGIAAKLLDAAGRIARDLGVDHVELRHAADAFPELPKRTDKVSMRLALPRDDDSLWRSFKPKLRAQIRRPTKEGASVVDGGSELVDEFYRVLSRNMRDLGTPVFSKTLVSEVARVFPNESRLFVVRLGQQPVGAALLLRHRKGVEVPWAATLRETNRYGINMILYWHLLRWSIAQGCNTFDFGRSTEGSGTFRFKQQWGAEPHRLYWHYLLPEGAQLPHINPENPKFRLLISLWQRQPVFLANLIGPWIARNLP
jgi:serine/alanine adding enzyme